MTKKFYETVLGVRVAVGQKDKLDAIAELAGEKTSRLVRDCIECLITNADCLVREKYKRLQKEK